MKTKAYIKQGSYQRSSKKINGALDINKEVLDTLVDKGLISTEDCCNYFLGNYLQFTGLLNQSGTSAPTVITLSNSLKGELDFVYSSPGTYNVIFPETYDIGKIWINIPQVFNTGAGRLVYIADVTPTYFQIKTTTVGNVVQNGVLVNTPIEIRIYP